VERAARVDPDRQECGIALVSPERPSHRVKHYDTGAGHIRASIDRSLSNLRVDVIDLLLIHRPDPLMDADETARALEEAVRSGKVRAVGVSNHAPGQLDVLQSRLSIPLVTNQIEFSVVETGALFDGTLDQAQRLRQSPMIWSPLGGGELFRPGAGSEHRTALLAALDAVARDLGVPGAVGAVALAFVLKHPSRPVPVLGTSRSERLRSYVLAEDLAAALDRQQWFSILEASRGAPVP